MQILENIDTIVSVICGVGSVIMFFLSKKEKDKCIEIKNTIEQSIEMYNKESSIKTEDTIKIERVTTFDNRKTIK